MNNLWNLLKVQLIGSFVSSPFSTKNKKGTNKKIISALLLAFVAVAVFATSFAYSYIMIQSLVIIGEPQHLLSVMMMAASVLVLIFCISQAASTLFKFDDYDMVMSLPIKTNTVVASRLIIYYITNALACLIIMLPAIIVYGMHVPVGAMYYVVSILLMLLIPIVPMMIGGLIGTAIAVIASKFKKNGFVGTVIMFIVYLGLFAGIMALNFMDALENFALIATELTEGINSIYPFAATYTSAAVNQDMRSIFMFAGSAIVILITMAVLVSTWFKSIHTMLISSRKGAAYKMKPLKTASQMSALYKNELKRFLHTPIYVFNMGFGIIMAIVLCIAAAVAGGEMIEELFAIKEIAQMIGTLVPFILSLILTMACTSCCSVSLEGKSLYIAKSIPVSTKKIFKSKLLLNLSLTVPTSLICSAILRAVMPLDIPLTVLLFVVPLAFCLFSAHLGLAANLWFPKMNWKAETEVVKQSASSFVGLLGCFPIVMIGIILIATGMVDPMIVSAATAALLIIGTVALRCYIMGKGIEKFAKL